MSVVAFRGRDPASEARALLNCVLRDGDVVGTDDQGRTALLLDGRSLDARPAAHLRCCAEDLEDDEAEPEPDQEMDGPATVLEFAPPGRLAPRSRLAQAVALALLLVAAPLLEARADQAPLMTRALPMSTAQTAPQCCRMCQKVKPCGDGCISAERQCKKDQGCACSASSGS